ncbi:hypothetical protein Q5P01_016603 [Channa striata]|uniref:ORF28 N-terminal domain-containing protein n=1 Tax=Channa striata TaxID=64152 RepID=A0AA88SAM2_CHASR|nr:hypothetical protein Q5P01_016603 [Channa striata]
MPSADPPATSTGRSIRAGPLFCIKDQSVYVKTSARDAKRAVLNATSMTLVDYADSSECRDEELRSDPSLFVPIFCKECYGTEDADYAEALARPGRAVFLHEAGKDIGRVECYWHVHSKSIDKTFLFCCVSCDSTEYAKRLLGSFAVDERTQQHTNGQRRDRPEQPRPLVARGAEHVPYYYSYGDGRSPAGTFEKTAHRDTLTEEQKRDIALAYNKRESEKEEASRKKREEMIAMIKTSVGDMIKTGIRDAMLERGYSDAVERDEQGDGVSRALARADPELRNLARDTPYNRRGRTPDRRRSPLAAASRDGDASVDVPSLLKELKELREQSARREDGKRKVESEETVSLMDTDDDERRCENATVPTAEPDARIGTRLPDNVTKKQQAGYPPPSRDADPVSDKHRLMEEFVSAVSTLR